MSQHFNINIMLLIFCGLPASGKTTLINQIIDFFNSKFDLKKLPFFMESIFLKISYDDILVYSDNLTSTHNSKNQFLDIRDWKSHRIDILCFLNELILKIKTNNENNILQKLGSLKCIENSISFKVKKLLQSQLNNKYYSNVIIILDDNFYYTSMRYSIYQICKKFELSFGQIYLPIDKNESLSRNYDRIEKVSDQSISNIAEKFEMPNELNNHWEKNTLIFKYGEKKEDDSWLEIFTFIEKCLKNPEHINLEIGIKNERSRQSKEVTLKNILHQTDNVLRKCISNKIKGENKKHFAVAINTLKDNILQKLRNKEIIVLNNPFYENKILNVEFENEIKDIFFREFQLLDITSYLN